MTRGLAPITQVYVDEFKSAADDLLKRGEIEKAKTARAIADAMANGEAIDLDTFRQPEN